VDLEHVKHLMLVYATYVIAVASPGPSTMAIIGIAMNQGRASAVAVALGVMTGSLFWAVLAATGISTILTKYAGLLYTIKVVGGFYLFYLAYKSAKLAVIGTTYQPNTNSPAKRMTLYRKGALFHLTNPKAILGWIAIMSLGLRHDATSYILYAIIAGCAILGTLIFVGYALIFSTAVMGHAYQKSRRWIDGTLAMVFGYAGICLLLSKE